jgi:hypothetical protein
MEAVKRFWVWIVFGFVLILAGGLQISMWNFSTDREDISFLYLDGHRILIGENPYSRVLHGNMRDNDKYTTYLPGFIELSFLTQRYYFREYPAWLALWRWIFLLCNLGIMCLLFWWGVVSRAPALAIFGVLLWAFNRWTLYLGQVSGMDILPIFFLLVSLYLLPKKHRLAHWAAWGLLGLSLALKQIAIFLVPLYLIHACCEAPKNKIRQLLLSGAAIATIPLLTSIPFLFRNPNGFIMSILFSLTRNPFQFIPPALSLDMFLGLSGIPARIPMIGMMLMVYAAAWRYAGRLSMNLSAMLIMAVFISFNPTLFNQYMPWFMLFLPLVVMDLLKREPVPASPAA